MYMVYITTSSFKLTGHVSDNLRLVAAISESFSTINFSLTSKKITYTTMSNIEYYNTQ